MNIHSIKRFGLALAALLVLGSTPSVAQNSDGEAIFSYTKAGEDTLSWGTNRTGVHNVAIAINDPALVGTTIKRIRMPFYDDAPVSDVKLWLSSALQMKKSDVSSENNVWADADIETVEVSISDGWAEATLAKPYTIPEGGVYAGCSFNVTSRDTQHGKAPLLLCTTGREGGFWIQRKGTYNAFVEKSTQFNGSLGLQVVVDGLKAISAGSAMKSHLLAAAGKATNVSVDVYNYGSAVINDIDVNYTVDGTPYSSHVVLGSPLTNIYGSYKALQVEIPAMSDMGNHEVTVTIDKVNGQANTHQGRSTGTLLEVMAFAPVHRAVVEEYTGTWCAYCPLGIVGMDRMSKLYPDDFIGLVYHCHSGGSDPMAVLHVDEMPKPTTDLGYPLAYVDRTQRVHPFRGENSNGFGLDKVWQRYCDIVANVGIEVGAQINEAGTHVNADATVTFGSDYSGSGLKVEFVLVADSLTGDDGAWLQYSQLRAGDVAEDAELEKFLGPGVFKVNYKDVVVATTRVKGEDVVLSSAAAGGESAEGKASFEIDKIVSVSHNGQVVSEWDDYTGMQLVTAETPLHIVALIVDTATGQIVNAAKAPVLTYEQATGISKATATTAKAGVQAIYDASGRKLRGMKRGVNIVRMTDGTTRKVTAK